MNEEYYNVVKMMDGVYRISSSEQVYMEFFVGKEKALLFDTGYGYGELEKVVKCITELPLYIVNSHGHLDHVCGNYQFREDIYIHPEDMELCRQHTSYEVRLGAVTNAKSSKNFLTGEITNILPQNFDEQQYLNGDCGNIRPVEEGHVFELGGITLKVYQVPGHTKGSIGLMYEEEKIFYVGDAMNPFMWLFMPEAMAISEYKKTLERVWELDFETLVMAHSPITEKKDVIKDYMAAADSADFEKGIPFETVLAPDADARICVKPGYTMQDMGKPGFASIIIGRDKL